MRESLTLRAWLWAVLTSIVSVCAAVAADPGTGEWTMFGNGPGHTGYYPKTIGVEPFAAGWSKTFTTSINQVAVSGDTIYATTNGYFNGGMRALAMKVSDGSEKWSYPLADAYSVNPPAYANGRVYFQRGNHGSDTHLWCLDAAAGTLKWAAPHAAQWERYQAPTIADGGVFVNGGYYGGMYGFDATTGAQRFFTPRAQEDGWTPAYANGVVYSCVNGQFLATDPATGSQLWARDLTTTTSGPNQYSYWYDGDVPVVADGKAVIVGGSRIVVLNVANRTQLWTKAGNYRGTPALADGVVYVFLDQEVKAYDVTSGTLLGTYTGLGSSGTLVDQPLVTKDLLLVSDGAQTFVFDRASFTKRQTLNAGGHLTYACGNLYVATQMWGTTNSLSLFTVTPTEADPPAASLPTPEPPQPRPNPNRPLGTTTVAWIDTVKAGGVAYFLFDNPAKIERYELASGTWLAPISLPDGPRGLAVSASGIYVTFGTSVSRFTLDGATETPLVTLATPTQRIFERNGRLYLADQSGAAFTAVDGTTGAILGMKNYFYSQTGMALAPGRGAIYARNTGVSPADIMMVSINEDGSLGAQIDSPQHGSYPNATRVFVFPGEGRVVDDAGIVYSAADLSYLGSFGGGFLDLDFAGDSPIVLRGGNTLVGFSPTFGETGRKTIAANQLRLYVAAGFAHSFAQSNGRGVAVTQTILDELRPVDPGTGIDPTNLTYTPDAVEFGGGTVFLLSKLHQSVFRWSVVSKKYLPTIKLAAVPQFMAYSADLNRLYLAYTGGRIGKVELANGTAETSFTNLPATARGLTAAGQFLFADDESGAWDSHYTFAPDGTKISAVEWNYYSRGYTWSAANRRMYFLRDDTSPNDLLWEQIDTEGKIGTKQDSPYHGDYGVNHPIRVAPDGSIVLLGNGDVYDGLTLERKGALPVPVPPSSGYPYYTSLPSVVDAGWIGSDLFSIRATYAAGATTPNGAAIQKWNTFRQQLGIELIEGTPLRLFPLSDSLLAVALVSGQPVFTFHDPALGGTGGGNGPFITRANPSRTLGQTSTAWLDATRFGSVAYFLFASPAKIERYDLSTGTWLDPISLPDGPTAFGVSASGIWVAFGASYSKFTLDGATETIYPTAGGTVSWIFEANGKLYLITSGGYSGQTFSVVDVASGLTLGWKSFSYSMRGLSFAKAKGKIFGRSSNVSPSDIVQVTLTADGLVDSQTDSPAHGDYPGANRTFLFPGEGRVVDDAGIIYSTGDLGYLGSFAGAFLDLDFAGESPVMLRNGNTLVGFSPGLIESGRKTIAANQLRLYVSDSVAHTFALANGRGVVATQTALDGLKPPTPGPAIDPTNLAYTPDTIEFGNGTVFLLSKLHQSIFRWSVVSQSYLTSISLTEVPQQMTYCAALNRLYLAYTGGRITKIDLTDATAEQGFANLPQGCQGLASAGEFLFAVDPSGAWNTHYTFASDGTRVSAVDWNYYSRGYTWSAANRRMYFLRDDTSPNDLLWEQIDTEGKLGLEKDSPYHGDYVVTHPIRVAPDGSVVVLGNGDIYDAISMNRLGALPLPSVPSEYYYYSSTPVLTDATWVGSDLFSIRPTYPTGSTTPNGGVIQKWNTYRQEQGSMITAGAPLRMFGLTDKVLAITLSGGKPLFTLYDASLGGGGGTGPLITRPNPSRTLAPTDADWIDAEQAGNLAYFLFASPAKIERYDMTAKVWLDPISLPDGPTHLSVAADGIWVSFGAMLSKFTLDGTTETSYPAAGATVNWLHEDSGKLYLATSQYGSTSSSIFDAIDVTTGLSLGWKSFFDSMTGITFDPAKHKIFGRSSGYTPSDILQITLTAEGLIGNQSDSPYHGDYPTASRTFVFPGGERVADDSGMVYSATNLTYAGSLGGAFTDLALAPGITVTLRDGLLTAYGVNLLEYGRHTIASGALRAFIGGDDVVTFAKVNGRGVVATHIPLTEFGDPQTPEPIDATNLVYTPDDIQQMGDTIYLLASEHRMVFRWSVSQSKYLRAIPLLGEATHMALSPANQRLYLGYDDGHLTRIELTDSAFRETNWATLPQATLGLTAAGTVLFASDPSGAWNTHYTFASDGTLISSVDWNYYSTEFIWSEANRRMYFTRDDMSPNDIHFEPILENGELGTGGESPYHGDYDIAHPIRVSPDGSIVILGTGDIYDAKTLVHQNAVPGPIKDAAWLGRVLHTLHESAGGQTFVRRWTSPQSARSQQSAIIAGEPLRLLAVDSGLVTVSLFKGKPRFTRVGTKFNGPLRDPAAGVYFARLGDIAGETGLLRVIVTGGRSVTAVFSLGRMHHRFKGQLDEEGQAVFSFGDAEGNWTLTFRIAEEDGMFALSGELSGDYSDIALSGGRRSGSQEAGVFPFFVDGATDDYRSADAFPARISAWGNFVLARSGAARIVGRYLGGTPFAQASSVLDDGRLMIHLPIRRGAGWLSGDANLSDEPISDWHAWLVLHRPLDRYGEQPGDDYVEFLAARYRPRVPAIDPGRDQNLRFTFAGGNLSSPLSLNVPISANQWFMPSLRGAPISINLAPRTGMVSGKVLLPGAGSAVRLGGVVNQKSQRIYGAFMDGNQPGRFMGKP